jgi:hypothetical protein
MRKAARERAVQAAAKKDRAAGSSTEGAAE